MKHCDRCDKNVPDFLWTNNDDHPILIDQLPMSVFRHETPANPDQFKISAEVVVERRMCKAVFPLSILQLRSDMQISEAVGLALGAASMCWQDVSAAGEFDSTRTARIAKELIDWFEAKQPIY